MGGLISGILVFTWAPEAEGHGTDAMIRAFHQGGGMIRARVPLIKSVASIITIGTGGSAGQEGPIAQIGAGFGSFLARVLRLPPSERRLLMLAGAAGGHRGDLPGAAGRRLFAGEVLYSSTAFESAALLPCLASSIVAYSTFALFITPEADLQPARPDLPRPARPAAVRGPDPALRGRRLALRPGLLRAARQVLQADADPPAAQAGGGGLLLGLIALAFPQVMTGGYGWVQWGAIGMPPELTLAGRAELRPAHGDGAAPVLCVLKIVATGLTISSGGSGGVFGPSMLIGGMLGGSYGQLMAWLLPGAHINPAAFVLVGMGGFFAGVSKTPLTSIVMVSEMTGSYSLLVPLDAGLRAEHGDLAALDDLRGAGAQPDRQPGAPGRLRGRRARADPGRRGRRSGRKASSPSRPRCRSRS